MRVRVRLWVKVGVRTSVVVHAREDLLPKFEVSYLSSLNQLIPRGTHNHALTHTHTLSLSLA